MNESIAVIGSGSFGSAIANVLAENKHQVTLWGRNKEVVDEINTTHTNNKYLKDKKLSKDIFATTELSVALAGKKIVLLAVPTKSIREVVQQIKKTLENKNVVDLPIIGHTVKGIEASSYKRISQVVSEVLDEINYPSDLQFMIAGPSHAESILDHDLTAVTVASNDAQISQQIAALLTNKAYFIAQPIDDLIGTEYVSALKNVYALAGGALSGLGYGDNALAALITFAKQEITNFIKAFGGQEKTIDSLAGIGDLIVTVTSNHSRNFQAGFQLTKNNIDVNQLEQTIGMVVEGIPATKAFYELANSKEVKLPILSAIYQVLYNEKEVTAVLRDLIAVKEIGV